jgi:hypothetical protein
MNGFDFFKGNLALKISDKDMERAIYMAKEYKKEMINLYETETQTIADGLTYEEPAYTEPDDDIDLEIDFFEID